jgi:hypothetical protein
MSNSCDAQVVVIQTECCYKVVKCVIEVYARGEDLPLSTEGCKTALQSRIVIQPHVQPYNLGRIDALIQDAKEKNVEIQIALTELAKAYKGLMVRQNGIYDIIHLGAENMEVAQFEMHSNMVIPSQIFAANVQATIAVMKAQSIKSYKEL